MSSARLYKKMKTRTFIAIISCALAALAFLLMGWLGRGAYERRHALPPQVDTVWRHDTIKLVKTRPAGAVVATLPVAKAADNDAIPDTTSHATQRDSARVEIPIVQRTFEGQYYRAVVQGYQPELVGIDIRLPEIAAPPSKHKWCSVTIGPQLGFGFTPAGWQPYAGIGVTVGITF